jgi:hypothetical protein
MANNEFQIPGRFIAAIFAKLHPAIYDVPPHGIDPFRAILKEFAGTAAAYSGASAVELNPQPLPPRWAYALKLADAYISEFVTLDRMGNLLGGDVAKRALDQSLSLVSDIDDICPRWPRWPWPWPPIPWPWDTGGGDEPCRALRLRNADSRCIPGGSTGQTERRAHRPRREGDIA